MSRLLTSCSIGLVIFLAGTIYTFTQTKVYEATGLLRTAEFKWQTNQLVCGDPMHTQMQVIQSSAIANKVIEQLSDEEQQKLIEPYAPLSEAGNVELLLAEHASFQPIQHSEIIPDTETRRTTYNIRIAYQHPSPEIAATICNAYMGEYISYTSRFRIDSRMKAIEDLHIRIGLQVSKIQEMEESFRENTEAASSIKTEDLIAFEQEIQIQKGFLTALQERYHQEKTQVNAKNPNELAILELATPTKEPVSPNTPLQLSLSLLAGICGGLFSFFTWGKFSRSANSSTDQEDERLALF